MASILKVDTIQDQSGNNIINESADTITIGASGDTITMSLHQRMEPRHSKTDSRTIECF
jgi:hypothetical protein